MVSAPPTAADGEAPFEELWLRQLSRWLRLGRDKVAILIEEASPGGLRPLMRCLLDIDPQPVVCFHAPELLDAAEGSLVVLVVQPDELRWLNLNRPILANRKLRLVLWLDFPLHELRDGAPDFFDWISHVVRCPERPPAFAVRGLVAAVDAERPLVWRGRGLSAVADAAGISLVRLDAGARFTDLIDRLSEARGREVVWKGVRDCRRMQRVQLTMQQDGRSFAIADGFTEDSAPWPEFYAQPIPWEIAASRVPAHAGSHSVRRLVALLECEGRAIDVVVAGVRRGLSVERMIDVARRADEPEAALAAEVSLDGWEAPQVARDRVKQVFADADLRGAFLKRHRDAVSSDHCMSWVRVADFARVAGHPDIAVWCSERAVKRAGSERLRRRAIIAAAAARYANGEHHEALVQLDEIAESVERESPDGPVLGLLLHLQASILADLGHHKEATTHSAHAIEIWESLGRRGIVPLHVETCCLHGQSLAAAGQHEQQSVFAQRLMRYWARTNIGPKLGRQEDRANMPRSPSWRLAQMSWLIEQARDGDDAAHNKLSRLLTTTPSSFPVVEVIRLQLAKLMLAQGQRETAFDTCSGALRSIRLHWCSEIHPVAVDARVIAARALRDPASYEAVQLLKASLADCREVYGEAAHERTLGTMVRLADCLRERGDLESARSLRDRARKLQASRLRGGSPEDRIQTAELFEDLMTASRLSREEREAPAAEGDEAIAVGELVAMEPDPETALARRGADQKLLWGLKQLPFEDQLIVALYYGRRLKIQVLASRLGLSPSLLRSRLRRARNRLSQLLRDSEAAELPSDPDTKLAFARWTTETISSAEATW